MACTTVIGKSTPAGDIVGTTDTQTLTNKTISLSSGDNTITAGNWQIFYTNGTGNLVELPVGASGTFLGGNGVSAAPTWQTPAGSGDVSKVGTPVDNQIGVWTGDGTIEGDADFTFNTTGNVFSLSSTTNAAVFNMNGQAVLTSTVGDVISLANVDDITVTAGGSIDVSGAGTLSIGASAGANNITIGGASSTLVIPGNLTVSGTTTTVDTATLDVTDSNITVNNGGNQATADANDAGLTVEMSDANDAIIYYDSTLTSKWAVGDVVSSAEIATVSGTQTLTNKTINLASNTLSTTLAQLQTAVSDATLVDLDDAQTLTNKSIDFGGNTITTTFAQLNTAVSDATLVDLDDAQTLSNKTLTTPTIASFTNATHNHQDAAGGGQLDINLATTGTLDETQGGTGQSTVTTGDILYGSGANVWSKLAIGSTGQNLAVVGGVLAYENPRPWLTTTLTGDTTAVPQTHYLANDGVNAAVVTLPAAPAVGDIVKVSAINANGWELVPNTSQTIHFLGSSVTDGGGAGNAKLGSDTTNARSSVEVVYVATNTWQVTSAAGCIELL